LFDTQFQGSKGSLKLPFKREFGVAAVMAEKISVGEKLLGF